MTEVISQNVNGSAKTEINIEEKFEASLNVIRNLPKDGPYKPSPEMMLKFYSYYKQATEGKCMKPKPWAWDVINKAKWDAWHNLGDMGKSEAMENYVRSLLQIMKQDSVINLEQIVEVIPVDENVQRLLTVVGDFYEIVEVEPGNQFKKFSKHKNVSSTPVKNFACTINGHGTNDPEGSLQDGEDSRAVSINGHHREEEDEEEQNDNAETSHQDGCHKIQEELLNDTEPKILNEEVSHMPSDSEDEFCDTAEHVDPSIEPEVITDTKDSPTTSFTLVNSDDNMGSGSSRKSDSLSNLDDSVEEESQGRNISDSLYGHSNGNGTIKAKIQTRGGEYGARGSDNRNPASSRQNAGRHSTQPGHSGDFTQMESTSRQRIGGSGGGGNGNDGKGPGYSYSEVQDQIAATLIQLQQDMNSVLNRLTILEALTVGQQARRGRTLSGSSDSCPRSPTRRHRESSDPSWWPFPDLSPRTTLFILFWPFAVRWILMYLRRRRRM